MAKPEILEETEASMFDIKQDLENIKKRDKELNFRAEKTQEYLNAFVKIKKQDYDALLKDLRSLNVPRLRDLHIFKLIDIMPKSPDEVKTIIQAYSITINNDNIKKISDTIAKYLPKKAKA